MELDAIRAQRMGLAQEVVPHGITLDRSLALAQHIATYPLGGIRADRRAALAGTHLPLEEGIDVEAHISHAPCCATKAMERTARVEPGERRTPPRRDEARREEQ